MTLHLLTRDHIAKRLEVEAIARHVKDGMTVLDVGCGDGETAIELAKRFKIRLTGIDSAVAMIVSAWQNFVESGLQAGGDSSPCFLTGDVSEPRRHFDTVHFGHYDLAYTQRCLVCLPDWEAQQRAIANIARCLKPGGLYVMCECSQDGLDAVNAMRDCVGLPPVMPPSWDRYLRDDEVEAFAHPKVDEPSADGSHWTLSLPSARCGLTLEAIEDYSGTYYFLSRVVNARLAADEGRELDYDSPVNRLALSLPPIAGLRGQGRLWLWRKA